MHIFEAILSEASYLPLSFFLGFVARNCCEETCIGRNMIKAYGFQPF